MELEKKDCIFERDNNGDIIPIIDILDFGTNKITKQKNILKIKFLPLTRSQYYVLIQKKELGTENEKDIDKQVILNNLVSPKFTEDDINCMKPTIFNLIVTKIMARSFGVTETEINKEEDLMNLDELKKKN